MLLRQEIQTEEHQAAAYVHCTHTGQQNARYHGEGQRVHQTGPFGQAGLLLEHIDEQCDTHHEYADVAHGGGGAGFKEEAEHNAVRLLRCPGLDEMPQHAGADKVHHRTGNALGSE